MSNLIALEPRQFPAYLDAIEHAGGEVVPLSKNVEALVWTDYARPDLLAQALSENPQLRWVQLPFAGVDAFKEVLQSEVVFTSAKRSYSEPVAEHALMLAMALGRVLPTRIRASSWGKKFAQSLFDSKVLIVGGGGIAQELVRLLEPFRAEVVVIRNRPELSFDNHSIAKVVGFAELDHELEKAQFVFVACALTSQTRFLFGAQRFSLMRPDSYLINVSRGEVVDQEALLEALEGSQIAGAALDVTYPEPLPDNHPLFGRENLIITPHTADTMEIVTGLFSKRLDENVRAYIAGEPLVGVVDRDLGY